MFGSWLYCFEEQPLEHLRPLEPVLGQVRRALGEVEHDRVRLAHRAAVVEHERRDAERGVEVTEQLQATGAVDHVYLAALVLDPQVGEQLAHLVAVA